MSNSYEMVNVIRSKSESVFVNSGSLLQTVTATCQSTLAVCDTGTSTLNHRSDVQVTRHWCDINTLLWSHTITEIEIVIIHMDDCNRCCLAQILEL